MFASLNALKAVHVRTGGATGGPGYFFDGHTGEAETLELIKGRFILAMMTDREECDDHRRVLYVANETGQIDFVAWLAFGVDTLAFIDEYDAANK